MSLCYPKSSPAGPATAGKPAATPEAGAEGRRSDRAGGPGRNPVTPRQADILALLAKGLADKQMAGDLGVSEETVAHHLRVMFDHYGVHSRAALVARLGRLLPRG